MRITRILTLLFLTFISCNNPLKVTIDKNLPHTVLDEIAKKGDTSIFDFYKEVRFIVDSIIPKSDNKLNLSSITYNELNDFYTEFNSKHESLKNDPKIKADWAKKYQNQLLTFSKDSAKYANYLIENNWQKFISIELLKIENSKGWLSLDKPEAIISLSGINGNKIRKVTGYIFLLKKPKTLENYSIEPSASGYFSYTGPLKDNIKERTYTSDIGTTDIKDSVDKLRDFVDIPVSLIKEDHNIEFSLHDLILDNKIIDPSFEKIPFWMRNYLIKKHDYYKWAYINSDIDKNFEPLNYYISKIVRDNLKNKYKKELDFYNFLVEYNNK